MPYEGPDNSADEFCLQLSKIEHLITQNADCHIILCGDFNVEFLRRRVHIDLLNNFCSKLDFCAIDKHSKCTIDYTYQFDLGRFSVLDHFITSSTLFDIAVLSASVWHDGDNLSDHHPIFFSLDIDIPMLRSADKIYREKISWQKANDDNLSYYKQTLSELLASVNIPVAALDCHNPVCANASHCSGANKYSHDLIEACLAAGKATLPHTSDCSVN
jgi:hypothetical protein